MPEVMATHVLLTDYGQFGWGISSPQLPGFIGGRETFEVLSADLDGLLAFAGADPGAARVIHLEKHQALPQGDEFVIRIARDEKFEHRWFVAQRLTAALNVTGQVAHLLDVPRRPTGEVLFICAEQGDTIGWLAEQLEAVDVSCIVVAVGEDMIRTQFFGTGESNDGPAWRRIGEFGWDADTTIGEIIRAQDAGVLVNRDLVAC